MPLNLKKKLRHDLKWGLIHTALVIFFADLIASFWPAFEIVWNSKVAHQGVALAAFIATVSEYLKDEEK